MYKQHCRPTGSADDRGQYKQQGPTKAERCMCFSSAGLRTGWSQAKRARPGSEGRLILASFLWSHPLTQLKLGPDLRESLRQGKGRGCRAPAFPGSQPGEGGVGSADSPAQFRTPQPVGRLWNCARLGRDGSGQHVSPHSVAGGSNLPCFSSRHLLYVLL